MTDIVERLLEDAESHYEVARSADMRPEDTLNWAHGQNCQEAADTITRLTAENEKLRAALRAVMDDLTLIGENHWLPIGLLDDVIYVNAHAALEEK